MPRFLRQGFLCLLFLLLLLASLGGFGFGARLGGRSLRSQRSQAENDRQKSQTQEAWREEGRLSGSAFAALPAETKELLKALRPCASCTKYERFGEANDGGYVLCAEHLDGIREAHSFGVNGFDGWGIEVSQRLGGIQVHEYDCTNPKEPVCPETGKACKLIFHPTCLKDPSNPSQTGEKFFSLHELLKRNPKAPAPSFAAMGKPKPKGKEELMIESRPKKAFPAGKNLLRLNTENRKEEAGDLLMKMDVEGAEWGALPEVSANEMRRFRQIVVEFHWLNAAKVGKQGQYLKAVKSILDSGFVVVHVHGNNYSEMGSFSDETDHEQYRVPTVLEVTFLNAKALGDDASRATSCDTTPELLPQDSPNNNGAPDLTGLKFPELFLFALKEQVRS